MKALTRHLTRRNLAILALTIPALWFALASTASTVLASRSPDAATGLGLSSARALQEEAMFLLANGDADGRTDAIRSLAEDALARDPLNVDAMQVLAQIEVQLGNEELGEELFLAAEDLSRREASIQLWLIERASARGDIPAILRHYDRAIRTSERSASLLLPILARAADNDIVNAELAQLLKDRPPWWAYFFEQYIATATNITELANLTNAIDLRLEDEGERQLFTGALQRLVQLGGYRAAAAIYSAEGVTSQTELATIRNGDFQSQTASLAPFGWSFANSFELAGSIELRPDSDVDNLALVINSRPGASGEVARQLLLLDPGQWELALTSGDMPQSERARPVLTISCASNPPQPIERELTSLRLARSSGSPSQALRAQFVVPAECPGQLLQIRIGTSAGGEQRPWIDDITLVRRNQ